LCLGALGTFWGQAGAEIIFDLPMDRKR